MAKILIDAHLDGHAKLLAMRLGTEPWRETYLHLKVEFLRLEQVGLDRESKDDIVWRLCQQFGYYLLTANRNLESEDSLEATIRREGKLESLPVFTLADGDRIFESAAYLDAVVESLLEFLLDQETIRGAGRLYLP